jgi:lipopolysaccharide heptosyltransferase II
LKNILVIRLSAIGDILLTTPVLARLRRLYPDAKIHFLVREQFAPFIAASPDVDEVHLWRPDDRVFKVAGRLRKITDRFDLTLDLQGNLKSRILATIVPAEQRYRYKKPYLNRLLLVYLKKNRYPIIKKISERYLEALEKLTQDPLTEGISLGREKLPKSIEKFCGPKTVLIAPGAKWFTKRWPQEYFASLASKLLEKKVDCKIIWLGGPDESEIFEFLQNHPYLRRHKRRMLFLSSQLTPKQMAQLADLVRVKVTNDSGLMHLLSASQTPLIALFLSTVEEFGFFPLGKSAEVLMARNIACRPCSHKGLPACPKSHFRCAFELTADQVYGAVASHLN